MSDMLNIIITSQFTLLGIVLASLLVFFQIQYAKYSKQIVWVMFKNPVFIIYLVITFLSIGFSWILYYKLQYIGVDSFRVIALQAISFEKFLNQAFLFLSLSLVVEIVLLGFLMYSNALFLNINNVASRKIKTLQYKKIKDFILTYYPLSEPIIIYIEEERHCSYTEEEVIVVDSLIAKYSDKNINDPFKEIFSTIDISLQESNSDAAKDITTALTTKLKEILAEYKLNKDEYPKPVQEHILDNLIEHLNNSLLNITIYKDDISPTIISAINHFEDSIIYSLLDIRAYDASLKILPSKRDLLEKSWGRNVASTNEILSSYESLYEKFLKKYKKGAQRSLEEIQRQLGYIFDIKVTGKDIAKKSVMYVTENNTNPYGLLFNLISKVFDDCAEKAGRNHLIAFDCGEVCIKRLISLSDPKNDFTDQAFSLLYDMYRIAEESISKESGDKHNVAIFVFAIKSIFKKAMDRGLLRFCRDIFGVVFELSLQIAQEIPAETSIGDIDVRKYLKEFVDEYYDEFGRITFEENGHHEWVTISLEYSKTPKADPAFWEYLTLRGPFPI